MVRKPGRHSERPEPGRRRAWFVVTALGLIAAARTVGLALLRDEGVLHWIVWAHPLPAHRAWVPFIHSPAFSEYVYQIDALARRYELPPEHFVIWLMALLQPAIVWAAYVAASGHGRRRRGMHAALLVTLAPTMLRPFEQYPLAILLVGAALAATAVYLRRGGPIAWAFALVLGFGAATTAQLYNQAEFGALTAITLGFAWIVDIFLTPVVAAEAQRGRPRLDAVRQ